MRALLDVKVLIALLVADHGLHRVAVDWMRGNAARGRASCPITQNGCGRVMSHPAYLALAVRHGSRFVTFDRGIALAAVKRAKAANLLVI